MERLGDWVFMAYDSVPNLNALMDDQRLLSVAAVTNASLLCGRLQLAVAVQRLVYHLSSANNALRSRNILSELLLMLSPTKNIVEALRLFQCEPDATVAVFAMHKPSREDIAYVMQVVKGNIIPLAHLSQYTDVAKVARVYGIGEAEVAHCGLENCVVNRIATCDV